MMRKAAGLLAALILWAVSPVVQAQSDPICQRGAVAGPVPAEYLLRQEARGYYDEVYQRMDPAAFDPGPDAGWEEIFLNNTLAQAIEWPGVLADRAADLPPKAHDLPWLALLAQIERDNTSPVSPLLIMSESILLPDLLPLMERHGLTGQARVLAEAKALFPDWQLNPGLRQFALYEMDGTEIDPDLVSAVYRLSDEYPFPGEAEAAALSLMQAVPGTEEILRSRLTTGGPEAALDQVLLRLRQECLAPEWYTPEAADAAYLSMGTAQAALLMMEDLALGLDGTSPQIWLDGVGADMAPHLVKVLVIRGETALADGLRRAMAEFPQPFPRLAEGRWDAFETMPPEAWQRIDASMPEDAYDRLRAAMLLLAQDSGLLPRP